MGQIPRSLPEPLNLVHPTLTIRCEAFAVSPMGKLASIEMLLAVEAVINLVSVSIVKVIRVTTTHFIYNYVIIL